MIQILSIVLRLPEQRAKKSLLLCSLVCNCDIKFCRENVWEHCLHRYSVIQLGLMQHFQNFRLISLIEFFFFLALLFVRFWTRRQLFNNMPRTHGGGHRYGQLGQDRFSFFFFWTQNQRDLCRKHNFWFFFLCCFFSFSESWLRTCNTHVHSGNEATYYPKEKTSKATFLCKNKAFHQSDIYSLKRKRHFFPQRIYNLCLIVSSSLTAE